MEKGGRNPVTMLKGDNADWLLSSSRSRGSSSRTNHPRLWAPSPHVSSWHCSRQYRLWAWLILLLVVFLTLIATGSSIVKMPQFFYNYTYPKWKTISDNTSGSAELSYQTTFHDYDSTAEVKSSNDDKAPYASSSLTMRAGMSPTKFPFRYRGPKLDEQTKRRLAERWGRWSLRDHKSDIRPVLLPCELFENCDIPRSRFPPNAWQTDSDFLKAFLPQAQDLVTRAQEAILAEYGQSQEDLPNMTFIERSVNFQLDYLSLNATVHPPNGKKQDISNAGWTTPRSFQGLVRRLLHSIMTQDTFTVAVGGHSVVAGHGEVPENVQLVCEL